MKNKGPAAVAALTILGGVLGGMFSGWFFSGQAQAKNQTDTYSDSVTARIFRLVDAQGNLRGAFCFDKGTTNPSLALMDKSGNIRAYLSLSDAGPSLMFRDHNDKPRLGIRFEENGVSSVNCLDGQGKSLVSVIADAAGGSKIAFSDNRGESRLGLGMLINDAPGLVMRNGKGRPQIAIFSHQGYGPGLFVHDSEGTPRMGYTNRGAVEASAEGDKALN
jgi:hypothetical protein